MSVVKRTLIALAVIGVMVSALLSSVQAADAGSGEGAPGAAPNPTAEMMLSKPSVLEALPTRIEYGSIKVQGSDYDITELAALVTVTVDEALRSTRSVLQEQVAAVELTVIDGYLVWAVILVRAKGEGAVLTIDAGNGKFLSLRSLQSKHPPWWEF
jgi:hypothetical protein